MLLGTRRVGYALSHGLGADAPPISVSWLVTAKLARVDRRGRPRGRSQWRRMRVSRIRWKHPARFTFRPPGKPGFYRLEIVFRDSDGKRLGRFGEYLRVLRRSLDVRLSLNQTSFKPGESVVPRLENYGTAYLSFGLIGAYYEHLTGATWTNANFGNGPAVAIGLGMGPGESAACWPTLVPAGAPPGRYRFSIRFGYSFDRDQARRQVASTEFDVTS